METQVAVCKTTFDANKFVKPYGIRIGNKPLGGGFWTSTKTLDGKSGWISFAESEEFYDDIETLELMSIDICKNARVLTIDSKEDYEQIIGTYGIAQAEGKRVPLSSEIVLNYDKLMKDYDALTVTNKGRLDNDLVFYGWDCESTVWFNIDNFENIK